VTCWADAGDEDLHRHRGVDMRKDSTACTGWCAIVRQTAERALVFVHHRRRTRLKRCVGWQRIWVCGKRLEKGRFTGRRVTKSAASTAGTAGCVPKTDIRFAQHDCAPDLVDVGRSSPNPNTN